MVVYGLVDIYWVYMTDNGFHCLCMSNIIRILAGSEIAKLISPPNGGVKQH